MADKKRDPHPPLLEADVPAWSNPTLLERIEQTLRGDRRPTPTRRQLAEGVATLGAMLPGPGTLDAMQKMRRGEEGDWIEGALGLTMAGAARPGLSAGRAAIANKNAARWGAGGMGASVPLSEGLRDDDTDGGYSGGAISAPSPRRPPMQPVDLDGNPVPDYGDLRAVASALPPSRYAGGGVVSRALDKLGFFSKAAEEAANLKQAKGTPEQMRAMLLKAGVKPDELKWTGFDDWAKGKTSITRDEAVQFLNENRVQVGEKRLGDVGAQRDRLQAQYLDLVRNDADPAEIARIKDQLTNLNGGDPKFSQYTLPGGDNYREVLLTRGEQAAPPPRYQVFGAFPREFATRAEAEEYMARMTNPPEGTPDDIREMLRRQFERFPASIEEVAGKRPKVEGDYRSSHWDEPNVLAHLRMKDRVDPEGRKVLHLEELQSDWAQEGRKKGFKTPEAQSGYDDAVKALEAKRAELQRQWPPLENNDEMWGQLEPFHNAVQAQRAALNGLPSAPYVDSTTKWTDLALKRALTEAANGGYDALAWTPGAEQAKRYDLSKQISRIEYSPEHQRLVAKGLDGEEAINQTGVSPEKLSDYIGKEAAERLMGSKPTPIGGGAYNLHTLEGEGLSVGGEGMRGYYDKIVPTQLQKLAKGLDPGAPFGTLNIDTPRGKPTQYRDFDEWNKTPESQPMSIPSLTITPAMREKIQQGLPLFTLPPAMLAGAGAMLPPSGLDQEPAPEAFSAGGKVDRTHYYETIPGGWEPSEGERPMRRAVSGTSRAIDDYIATEIDRLPLPKPPLRRGEYGIDPIREGREEMFREMRGYEEGGAVIDAPPAPVEEEEGDGFVDDMTLQELIKSVLVAASAEGEQS